MKTETLLIIEDNEFIRKDLENSLTRSGYNVFAAESGEQGIDLAKMHMPDLIICDIMLPNISGYDVLEKVQSHEDTAETTFMFLTAKSSPDHVRKGMHLGADDYITKPYDLEDLLESVKTRLRKKKFRKENEDIKYKELKNSVSRYIPHEIRTPLNIIMGLSEYMIKNYNKSEEKDIVDMLGNIYDSGRRLNRLFENYLFYANLELISNSFEEKKKLRSYKTPLCLYLLKDLINTHLKNYGRASDLNMKLKDATLAVAEKYLSKIILELIDNAVKFSETGSEIIIKSNIDNNKYIIDITNFGRGMSKSQIDSIDAYVQFERKMYEQQGSGLGLSIVKKIAELHAGKFEIISEPDSFTTVRVYLPIV